MYNVLALRKQLRVSVRASLHNDELLFQAANLSD